MNLNVLKALILTFCSCISLVTISQTTLVNWNFPNNPDNATADGGIAANAAKAISTVGTGAISFANGGATTRCAEASGWDAGNGTKYWMVDFVSTGYTGITVSSKQRSENNDGPRDFRLEYRIGAGAWTIVTGGNITVQDNFTGGVLNNLALPAACDNQTQVFLRWIMTSNTDEGGGTVIAAGYNRIDDIIISGNCSPTTPSCATYSLPANSTTVCPVSQTLSWSAISTPSCGTVTYDVYFNSGATATTLVSSSQAGTTYPTGALTAGTTYAWRIVPRNGTLTATGCSTFSFTATASPPNCISGAITPVDGSTMPCPLTATTNLTWTAPTASCGNAATGYSLFVGTNNPPTNMVNGTAVGNVTSYSVSGLSSNTVYYWRVVPTNSAGSASGCSTYTFTTPSTPSNDLPCNAVGIPLGTIASGDNNCSGNSGEPATPACWTGGNANTVWFSFTAPASGNVKIRTAPGTLLNTQIAVYSGACGAGMTLITGACNRDAAACGSTPVLLSELSLTGLTNGATYRIAVDGENSLVGTFAITVVESTSAYPSSSGQTCSSTILACNSSISIGNPGFQGIGFTCDDNGAGNCTSGERGSVWYTINIQNAGNLNFSIIPNDYNAASPGTETDYDFVLWKTAGTGSVSCSSITSGGGAGSIRCNYSGYGVTGVGTGGDAPPGYNNAYDDAYENTVAVVAGEQYMLLIENYSNSTAGFSLDLSGAGAGVINYTPPTTVTWTGGANTSTWTSVVNWGGCTAPACGVDAVISTSSSFQPLISSTMGTITVNNLTIDPGAILTLGPNAVLNVCGNITNNGSIVADATSTITFTDNATHTLNGTLSGSSTFGNVVITDAAGGGNCTLLANTSIELKGNLTTSNVTSIFNLNGNNLSIAGNFNNSSGATTFINTAGSTITFKGTASQSYNPNMNSATPALTLNNVVLNNTGTGVILSTTNAPNMILGTSGVLTLTAGKIITPNSQEVTITNTNPAAVNTGNSSSYVEGNLRRHLAAGATGSFDFPVGNDTRGYQRANINFTSAAAAGAINLLARFDAWGGAWVQPAAPNWSECSTTYNDPYLNNGYWSIDASSPSTGLYDLTLYNTNYTTTSAGFSIAKSSSAAPSWSLSGNCVSSPPTAVVRQAMSGFSKMATIQGNAPLPVELISFTGINDGSYNLIYWKSAIETNFRHYELESSEDGTNFTKITTVNPIGNLSSFNNYNYLDFNPFNPITYYRLKMIDLDYTYEYSAVISVENKTSKQETFIVYPNPASGELYVKLVVPGEKEAMLEIKDIFGRSVYQQKIDLTQAIDNTYININNFSSGTYIVNITAGNSFSENTKVVIGNKNQ
ncbi:MAG: T9SS type A sorting domain-containing protein [Bacteroidota bacterium]